MRKTATSCRIGRPLGLTTPGPTAIHARPARQIAGRGRTIARGQPMRIGRRARAIMALTPPRAASALSAATGTLAVTGPASTSAATSPASSRRPSLIPPRPQQLARHVLAVCVLTSRLLCARPLRPFSRLRLSACAVVGLPALRLRRPPRQMDVVAPKSKAI